MVGKKVVFFVVTSGFVWEGVEMMHIVLNGQPYWFAGNTLADLIDLQQPAVPFAVAVNTVFIAKPLYATTVLHEQDCVEIVRPVVGG